jgi:hypothetical protein
VAEVIQQVVLALGDQEAVAMEMEQLVLLTRVVVEEVF